MQRFKKSPLSKSISNVVGTRSPDVPNRLTWKDYEEMDGMLREGLDNIASKILGPLKQKEIMEIVELGLSDSDEFAETLNELDVYINSLADVNHGDYHKLLSLTTTIHKEFKDKLDSFKPVWEGKTGFVKSRCTITDYLFFDEIREEMTSVSVTLLDALGILIHNVNSFAKYNSYSRVLVKHVAKYAEEKEMNSDDYTNLYVYMLRKWVELNGYGVGTVSLPIIEGVDKDIVRDIEKTIEDEINAVEDKEEDETKVETEDKVEDETKVEDDTEDETKVEDKGDKE